MKKILETLEMRGYKQSHPKVNHKLYMDGNPKKIKASLIY